MFICNEIKSIDCSWCPFFSYGNCEFASLEQAIDELKGLRDQIDYILEELKNNCSKGKQKKGVRNEFPAN